MIAMGQWGNRDRLYFDRVATAKATAAAQWGNGATA
jgi:hypothetical protein